MIYSLEVERHSLSAVLRYPDILSDIDSLIKETDYFQEAHKIIFSIIKASYFNQEKIDKVLIAQKIKNLGVSFKEGIDIFDYIDSLSISQITREAGIESFKELAKLRFRRELYQTGQEISEYVKKNGNLEPKTILAKTDGIYNKTVNSFIEDDEPVDLYKNLESFIQEIAANPQEESGLITPYQQYNRYFSGLKPGDGAYFYYARMGEGKSVWLYNLAKNTSLINKAPTLYLDTEMSLNLNMFRAGAMEADINSYYIQTGKWIKNQELAKKMKDSFEEYKKYSGLLYHKYVPNRDIDEIISIIKRWYYKCVGRGNKAIIVYDYLKISGDIDQNRNEWQQLGDKISFLNEVGHNLNIPILLAGQQNRGAVDKNQRFDSDVTIAGSDRINQYARFSGLIRKKTIDEIAEHGPNFGTHILLPTKYSRDQGVEDFNMDFLVRIEDVDHNTGKKVVKYEKNYLCYEIKNYKIIERGTLRDIIHAKKCKAKEQKIEKETCEI